MDIKKGFAQALRQLRDMRGLVQEDFAMVSSRTYLSTLERGLKSPTLDKVTQLSAVLEVHPVLLLASAYAFAESRDLNGLLLEVARSAKEIETL